MGREKFSTFVTLCSAFFSLLSLKLKRFFFVHRNGHEFNFHFRQLVFAQSSIAVILFSDGPNFIKILYFFALFFLHKNHIIDVNFGYFIHKCVINSLDVHPKFDTGAALWPPLLYSNDSRPVGCGPLMGHGALLVGH